MRTRFEDFRVAALLPLVLGLLPSCLAAAEAPLSATAQKLLKDFSSAEETLEYHFMLNVPAVNEANRAEVVAALVEKLKPIVQIGELTGPKTGAYIDTRDRVLDKAHLILRLRPGLFTVKARSTSLNELIDLQACTGQKVKYERDFFEEPGYSISSEYKFKKEEWIADPTKATVQQTMAFMQDKCPSLLKQLEPFLQPMQSLAAPGTAQMYSAEIKLDHPLNATFKESGFSLWMFPGSAYTLGEIAWTGKVKDKSALDQLYQETREKLMSAGLLAQDQSSKTEQYFYAYFGVSALDSKYGALARPAYIKHFEADAGGKVIVSPYVQVATRSFPAYLDPAMAPYNYVINADGHVAVVPETRHPYGRVYANGFLRPEDKSQKKPGTGEQFGHASALAGQAGRISGEILYDKATKSWSVNNKSGRYSKNNPDRTPEQLVNAANLIRSTVDAGDAAWGPVQFIFEFGPEAVEQKMKNDPGIEYEDPAKKKRPRITVLPAANR